MKVHVRRAAERCTSAQNGCHKSSSMSLYHYTTVAAAKSIQKDGVLRSSPKGEGGAGVYVTTLTWGALTDTFMQKLRVDKASKNHARFEFDLGEIMQMGRLEAIGDPRDKQFIFRGDLVLDRFNKWDVQW